MSGLFAGTSLERPVTCETCQRPLDACRCPRNASGRVCRPSDQRVRVTRQKRRKGKQVTVVEGLDPVASDLTAILKELKTACAAGGAIVDGAIEVQGDHVERVCALLQAKSYPVK